MQSKSLGSLTRPFKSEGPKQSLTWNKPREYIFPEAETRSHVLVLIKASYSHKNHTHKSVIYSRKKSEDALFPIDGCYGVAKPTRFRRRKGEVHSGYKVQLPPWTRRNLHPTPPLSASLIPQRQMNPETQGEVLLPQGVVTWSQGEFWLQWGCVCVCVGQMI